MAAWKQGEIDIIKSYFEGHSGPVTTTDYEALGDKLPGRSTAGIKKKTLQVREAHPREAAPRATWSTQKYGRLQAEYSNAPGRTKEQKLQAIAPQFPGRSAKSLAAQLRNKSPEVYYGRTTVTVEEANERRDGGRRSMTHENRISDDIGERQQQQQRSNVARGRARGTGTGTAAAPTPPQALQLQTAGERARHDPLPGVGREIPAQMKTQHRDSPVRRRSAWTESAQRPRGRLTRPSVQREIPAQQHRGSLEARGISGADARQGEAVGAAPSVAAAAAMTAQRVAPHIRVINSSVIGKSKNSRTGRTLRS